MKNYEQYKDAIRELRNNKFYINFIKPYLGEVDNEYDMDANACAVYTTLELMERYTEPEESEVDWNAVKVDTPILVRNAEDEPWLRRYFAKYENGRIHIWSVGRTSWTANTVAHTTSYAYAKLATEEE